MGCLLMITCASQLELGCECIVGRLFGGSHYAH